MRKTFLFCAIWSAVVLFSTSCFAGGDPLVANEKYYTEMLSRVERNDNEQLQFVIAIIDSGINDQNPELWGSVIAEYDFIADIPVAEDCIGHGTKIASIISAAKDGRGISGIMPEAKLIDAKVVDDAGHIDTENIIKAIQFSLRHGADVINMSFSGTEYSEKLAKVIRENTERGIIFVAAAGNDGSSRVTYPAGYPGVYAIGSRSEQTGEIASYSNKGDWVYQYITDGAWTYDGQNYSKQYGTSESAALFSATVQTPASLTRRSSTPEVVVNSRKNTSYELNEFTPEEANSFLQESDAQSYLNSLSKYLAAKEAVNKVVPQMSKLKYEGATNYSKNLIVSAVDFINSGENIPIVSNFNKNLILMDMFADYARTAYANEYNATVFGNNTSLYLTTFIENIEELLDALTFLQNSPSLTTNAAIDFLTKLDGIVLKTKNKSDAGSRFIRKLVNYVIDAIEGPERRQKGISRYRTKQLSKHINDYIGYLENFKRSMQPILTYITGVRNGLITVANLADTLQELAEKQAELAFLSIKAIDYFTAIGQLDAVDTYNNQGELIIPGVYNVNNRTPFSEEVAKYAKNMVNSEDSRQAFMQKMLIYAAIQLFGEELNSEVLSALANKLANGFSLNADQLKNHSLEVVENNLERPILSLADLLIGALGAPTLSSIAAAPPAVLVATFQVAVRETVSDYLRVVVPAYMYLLYRDMVVGLNDTAIYNMDNAYIDTAQIQAKIAAAVMVHRFAFYTNLYIRECAVSKHENGGDYGFEEQIAKNWIVTLDGAHFNYAAKTWRDNLVTAFSSSGMGNQLSALIFKAGDFHSGGNHSGVKGYLNYVYNCPACTNEELSEHLSNYFNSYLTIAGVLNSYKRVLSDMASISAMYDVVAKDNTSKDRQLAHFTFIRSMGESIAAKYGYSQDKNANQCAVISRGSGYELETQVPFFSQDLLLAMQRNDPVFRKDFMIMAAKLLGVANYKEGDDTYNPYRDTDFIWRLTGFDFDLLEHPPQPIETFPDIDTSYDGKNLSFNEKIWLLYQEFRG